MNNIIKAIVLLCSILAIILISFLPNIIKVLLILGIVFVLYFICASYKKQVEVLIFIIPLTDVINKFSHNMYKSLIGIYILFLFLFIIIKKRNLQIFNEKVFKSFGLFIMMCLISIIYVPNKVGAIEEVIKYISMGGLVGLVYYYINTLEDSYKLLRLFIKSSIIPIIVGCLQIIFKSGMNYGEYDRVISTFGHSSDSGFFFTILSLVLILVILSKSENLIFKNRILVKFMFILSLILLYKTYTRSAWINFALSLSIVLICWYRKSIIYFIYLTIPALFLAKNSIEDRFSSELSITGPLVVNVFGINISGSYASRIYFWQYGLKNMFLKNIFMGTGISSFFYTYSPEMHQQLIGRPESVEMHNDFIKTLCELGIFGAFIYIINIIVIFRELIIGLKQVKERNSILLIRCTLIIYFTATVAHFSDVVFRLYSIELIICLFLGIAIKMIRINKYKSDYFVNK